MIEGQCPSCGAPVVFTAGSAQIVVCGHCQTVVGRKGPALEARGKVGAIVPTDSPLQLHVHGVFDGRGYRIVGHLQKDHGAGPWDEWYVEFDDGRRGWISEAEGQIQLLSYVRTAAYARERLEPGTQLLLDEGDGRERRFVVEERGEARVVAAAGELPTDIDTRLPAPYVDATGANGAVATLDFSHSDGEAEIFVGRKVELEQLGIPPDQLRPRVRKVALVQARCTECNGPLELRAPDRTKRVACPYCGALLDVTQGRLSFLRALEKPDHEPVIPLGGKGTLKGTEWTCIGMLVRSCEVDYDKYWWSEYLLYNPARGFTWLMLSNGHWVFLQPVAAGDVTRVPQASARYKGRRFKAFQIVEAVTEYVLGEFYWEVTAGERAQATEFVDPPYSLNEDRTETETTFTFGEYLPPETVKEAFGLQSVPTPTGIAPSQPNQAKIRAKRDFAWAAVWSAVLVAIFVGLNAFAANKVVFLQTIPIPPGVRGGTPEAMYFSQPFDIPVTGNLKVELYAPVSNAWFGVEGDLVNVDTQEITRFYNEVGFYTGFEEGERWREGRQSDHNYLSRIPAGRYTLRLTPYFDVRPGEYRVKVINDTPRLLWLAVALGALFVVPFISLARSGSFETARWNESNLAHGDEE